ncbi:MAG: DUF4159 domain-containing protein [Rubricoccaceae bacterium]|nr:DUF4159 domain-containing protein [Rubricoccaceae bacterium]
MLKRAAILFALVAALTDGRTQDQYEITIARVQYGGGGDWYSGNPLPNLIAYLREHTLLDVAPEPETAELDNDNLFQYPFLYLNGHGNVFLTEREALRLRRYLEGGGFLYINDDYGLDEAVRREMQKVFPNEEFSELPLSHPIYSIHYRFPDGLPKIHEHDGEPARGFGLFHEDRLCVFYAHESDLADGWEAQGVHNDPQEIREQALKMGVNLVVYAMMSGRIRS